MDQWPKTGPRKRKPNENLETFGKAQRLDEANASNSEDGFTSATTELPAKL